MIKQAFFLLLKCIGVIWAFQMMYLGGANLYISISGGFLQTGGQRVWEIFFSGVIQVIIAFIILYFVLRRRKNLLTSK